MIDLHTLSDLSRLRESVDLECKLAAGRDGQGAVPEDFWPSYSAFANTQGGVVILGLREKKGVFSVDGIANPAKVQEIFIDGKTLLRIDLKSRKIKSIYKISLAKLE